MSLNLIVENVVYSMTGGARLNKNNNMSIQNSFMIFLISFILLLIKGYIVYISYNILIPKIMYSLYVNKSLEEIENNFRQLSYMESILLVILTNTLFT
jgi:hypothetical protein